jgi:D-glycero-D-manno-heptose 1,7-bisphosphate phosphatase
MTRRLVLLDRDGILNPDVGYPHRLEDAVLFPDVIPALLRLQASDFEFAIVSNQSGVGRGYFSLADATQFNAALTKQLRSAGIGISLSHFFLCPHTPADMCDCRKPQPGLLRRAARAFDAELESAVVVGDAETDVAAGRAAGAQTILVIRSGPSAVSEADWVVRDLQQAAAIIGQTSVRPVPRRPLEEPADWTRRCAAVLQQIEGEYRESSGLRLSSLQIQRLWKLEAHECGRVVEKLVANGFLRQTRDGTFCRCD